MESVEEEFSQEFESESKYFIQNYIPCKAPTNSLDYMKFNSEEYLKYKFDLKVKNQLNGLNLDSKLLKEICQYSYFLSKKLEKDGLKISDIIAIVAYKIIKNNNIPLSQNQIFKELQLSKSKYIKFSNSIDFNYTENSYFNKDEYLCQIFQLTNSLINRMIELYKFQPNIIKINSCDLKLTEICQYIDGIKNYENCNLDLNSYFIDIVKSLEDIKNEIKIFIKLSYNETDFTNFFQNKVLKENLVAALIKFIMSKKGLKINLSTFSENFKIAGSSISHALKLIKIFNKTVKKE